MRPLEQRLFELRDRGTIVVAHRGDPVRFPENTLAAYRAAAELGVDMIEFDIRETRDAQFVCIHDATFDRTTDSGAALGPDRRVEDATLEDARRLDAGHGERVPELVAALAAMRPAIPMIERKAGSARDLIELLRTHDLLDDVLLQAFDWDWIEDVRQLEPRIALGLLGGDSDRPRLRAEDLPRIRSIGACLVHWQVDRITADDVTMLGDEIVTCVFTANESEEFDRVIGIGIDAITTNYPARLLEHLAR